MTDKLSRSPDRNTFQRDRYLDRMKKEERTPENDETVLAMMEFYDSFETKRNQQENDPAWRENNLEYDLRSSVRIVDKCRGSEVYSQNLYAALCNTEWQKLEVMPILKDQTWSCSWRYAGGIVADLRGEGDYIDWYCSGIRSDASEKELAEMNEEDRARYLYYQNNFVGESTVTDEIRADFLSLGWQQANEDSDE